MDSIRIQKIQVKRLFGDINYNIDLNNGKPVAIITAPNGRGKTTLLNLTAFVLNPQLDTFTAIRSIPFDEYRCILSNGRIVELKPIIFKETKTKLKSKQRSSLRRVFKSELLSIEDTDFAYTIYDAEGKKLHSKTFTETYEEAIHKGLQDLLDENDEIADYRGRGRSEAFLSYVWKALNQMLEETHCIVPINYIKADRTQPVLVEPKRRGPYSEPQPKSPLVNASMKVGELIRNSTEEYNDAVSKAKDKLPQMFLDGEGSGLDCDQFMKGWSVYREELDRFQEIGLITPTEDFTKGKSIENVYKEKGEFLSTYLSAFKDTTASLKDVYDRLNLFKQILDERNEITGKQIVFSRDGITIMSGDREILLDSLSSGEKHDFIMFYNLIFNIDPNGLFLVDEPEISLHIEWQETYLDKLLAICEMNDLQAIVATHSPNIVSSHYDCLVDKGETNGQS